MHTRQIDDLQESLAQCAKLSQKAKKKNILWFARQNTSVQIQIFHEQKKKFFIISKKCLQKDIASFAAFLLAISYFRDLEKLKNQKNKKNLHESKKASDFFIKKFLKTRRQPKKEKLLDMYSVILKLQKEGYSLRQISKYLKARHRFTVSHTYLSMFVRERHGT